MQTYYFFISSQRPVRVEGSFFSPSPFAFVSPLSFFPFVCVCVSVAIACVERSASYALSLGCSLASHTVILSAGIERKERWWWWDAAKPTFAGPGSALLRLAFLSPFLSFLLSPIAYLSPSYRVAFALHHGAVLLHRVCSTRLGGCFDRGAGIASFSSMFT